MVHTNLTPLFLNTNRLENPKHDTKHFTPEDYFYGIHKYPHGTCDDLSSVLNYLKQNVDHSNSMLEVISQKKALFLIYLKADKYRSGDINNILTLDRNTKVAFFAAIQDYNSTQLFQNDSDASFINIYKYFQNDDDKKLFKFSKVFPHLKTPLNDVICFGITFNQIINPNELTTFIPFLYYLDVNTFTSPLDIKDVVLDYIRYKNYDSSLLSAYQALLPASQDREDFFDLSLPILVMSKQAIIETLNSRQDSSNFSSWPTISNTTNLSHGVWQGVFNSMKNT
mgnify:FL=1